MHGLNETGPGWYLEMKRLMNRYQYIRFILPTAAHRPITIHNNYLVHGWYNVESLSHRDTNEYNGKEESKSYVFKLIDNEINNYHIDSNRIIVAGFGQGASLALYSGLQYAKSLAGIVCLCGCLLDYEIESKVHRSNLSTLILMIHGTLDDNVPFEHGLFVLFCFCVCV